MPPAMPGAARPLPAGCITDVAGIRVGQVHRVARGWRTGTTVVLVDGGAIAGCDVRGGGPGTRETDLLRPEAMIERIDAICLTGGSAYGLAAADGVMTWLAERGVGFPVGPLPEQIVPIVPAAVIFDLGRGGRFANRPDASFGHRAANRATARGMRTGDVGAGTGARAGGLQGGVGTASVTLASGAVVGSLAVVNAAGQVIDPATALPWIHDHLDLRQPPAAERAALGDYLAAVAAAAPAAPTRPTVGPGASTPGPLNTTIGVVATSAELTKAECHKLAAVAHDGLARAVRPVHSMFDGDVIFGLSTAAHELHMPGVDQLTDFLAGRARYVALNELLAAAANCFATACTVAIIDARSTPEALCYRELCPSAFPDGL